MTGYVQVYTGDGKGKTTAAMGLALRAAGAGLKVFIAQFVKSEKYSEIFALERFPELITCRQYGSGCWLQGQPGDGDVQLARSGLEEVRQIVAAGKHDVVILDPVFLQLLQAEQLHSIFLVVIQLAVSRGVFS